jgi:hypothetical protein
MLLLKNGLKIAAKTIKIIPEEIIMWYGQHVVFHIFLKI